MEQVYARQAGKDTRASRVPAMGQELFVSVAVVDAAGVFDSAFEPASLFEDSLFEVSALSPLPDDEDELFEFPFA
jgi:hypothetical protein